MATAILPEVTKRIAYNAANEDYDCYITIDGESEEYIGSAARYSQAEKKCSDYAYDYYSDRNTPEKAVQIALNPEIATTEDVIAVEMAEYAEETRLYCLDLDPFDSLILDKTDTMNLYLDGTGMFAIEAGPGQLHSFTRDQTAAIYRFFQGDAVERRMLAVLRAVLIERGRGGLVAALEAPLVRGQRWINSEGDCPGTQFLCGTGDAEVEVFIDDDDPHHPMLFLLDRDALELDAVERVLPNIIALLADPRVRAARKAV